MKPTADANTEREIARVERARVDTSARVPVLFFFTTAITWLFAATFFGTLASLKLHLPELLGNLSWLTYGRIWPAYIDTFVYGWGCLAGMGTAIWLTARLCRVTLRSPGLLIIAGVFWNIGVTVGIAAILSGNSQGLELLEFPRFAAAILFIAYAFIAVWGVLMFRRRRPGHIYISLWYLIGAFFWFPWLYGATYLSISFLNVHGVVQAAINAWFAQNLISFWFGSIGLGAIYYFIPKVIGRPVHSYNLASLGFWSFALFSGWTASTRLTGGPFPAWFSTVGIVACIMMLIPVATVTVNYMMTMRGYYHMVYHSPTIRFIFYGAIAWTITNVIAVLAALRSSDRVIHFTHFVAGQLQLNLYAFFSMVIFASMYYIVPRLVGCEWLSASFIRIHFWGSAYGIGLLIAMLLLGGIKEGLTWDDPSRDITAVLQETLPYLRARSIAWLLLILGHFIFAVHFLIMLLRMGRPGGEATLFAEIEDLGGEEPTAGPLTGVLVPAETEATLA
ncbi:MAG: cbb3-type cytochrome c oxidase subunit I [Verrucomicrobiota bacterium]|nr:cbb3-type cytochrome c oxidase subunit I [Verrucomicrobiota bacterium]